MHANARTNLEALSADHRIGIGETQHAELQFALREVMVVERMVTEGDVTIQNLIGVAVAAEIVDAQSVALAQSKDELAAPLIQVARLAKIALRAQRRSGHPGCRIDVHVG